MMCHSSTNNEHNTYCSLMVCGRRMISFILMAIRTSISTYNFLFVLFPSELLITSQQPYFDFHHLLLLFRAARCLTEWLPLIRVCISIGSQKCLSCLTKHRCLKWACRKFFLQSSLVACYKIAILRLLTVYLDIVYAVNVQCRGKSSSGLTNKVEGSGREMLYLIQLPTPPQRRLFSNWEPLLTNQVPKWLRLAVKARRRWYWGWCWCCTGRTLLVLFDALIVIRMDILYKARFEFRGQFIYLLSILFP